MLEHYKYHNKSTNCGKRARATAASGRSALWRWWLVLTSTLLLAAMLSASARAEEARAFAASSPNPAAAGVKLSDPKAISAFYAARGGAPLWTGAAGLNQRALDLISALEQAWTHGLNPARYHLAAIESILGDPENASRDRLELLLTDALIRYGRDLTGTRAGISRGGYDIHRKPLEPAQILETAARSTDLNRALRALEPQGALYQALRKELAMLLSEDREDSFTPIDFGKSALSPGDSHPSVEALRARLGLPHKRANAEHYDEALVHAVKAFQKKHRLDSDGIVGPNTLRVLNRDREGKIKQILANLERLRWLDQDRPERYVIVNIPSQTLWLVRNREVVEEMKVIVGKPARGTKDFKTLITGVRFNPTWTVPPTIKRKDFLPKLVNNPDYLKEKGISLLRRQEGRMVRVDSSSVDWASVSGDDLAGMSMVQSAGARNALGKVRVLMPNPYDMYLHDTSNPELFEEDERTLSSGCIRIENPEAVADFILSANEGWSVEKRDSLIAAGRTVDVPAEHKIPVYVIYQTIWLDAGGKLVFGDDVYGRDAALLRALDGADSLPYFKS